MIRAWIISITTLVFAFFFWIVGGPLVDALYTYAFESAFIMSTLEMSIVKALYTAWDYMLLAVVGIIAFFNITYAVYTR